MDEAEINALMKNESELKDNLYMLETELKRCYKSPFVANRNGDESD